MSDMAARLASIVELLDGPYNIEELQHSQQYAANEELRWTHGARFRLQEGSWIGWLRFSITHIGMVDPDGKLWEFTAFVQMNEGVQQVTGTYDLTVRRGTMRLTGLWQRPK
jgi:hypothetical protein